VQYDAWRVGANTAMDWAWWGQFEWEKTHADTLQSFFMTKGIKSYSAIYSTQVRTCVWV
jgi:endo-1,4-beta-D-glucanase Y